MIPRRQHIAYLFLLTVVLMFMASYLWENGLEEVASGWFGWAYEPKFEDAERWRFIVTSTAFAALAQLIPAVMLAFLVERLSRAFHRAVTLEEKARSLALQDPLTGLANRRHLRECLEEAFRSSVRCKLLLIDLDRFKSVNDTYGHAVGDQVLVEVAARLTEIGGEEACSARLGGDELAVLVYDDLDKANAVASAIALAIDRPFEIASAAHAGERRVTTTLSIGCSIGLCCSDDACDPDELIKRADLALYQAKRGGGGHVSCYQPGMLEHVIDRGRLEADMRVAVAQGQFHLVYQPLLDLEAGAVCGYEALIRWDHPERGVIAPAEFIPLAEETGLIIAIGAWVLREACREAALWPKHQNVAVNISAAQFRTPLLFAHVTAALAESGLVPQRLQIELTETAMVEDRVRMAHVLTSLRALGVTVAMDDFGTGYSSLAHLRDFPLDRIKIDRSFVATAASNDHSMAVIRAIVQIGRDLGIETLGEGVETPEQLALLQSLGCNAAQGFLIGRPGRLTPARAEDLPPKASAMAAAETARGTLPPGNAPMKPNAG